jgi:uncharacterized protein
MSPEQERESYLKGIDLFNEHQFFEAHEVWEDVWNIAFGIKHDFYQGMIQCAVALEHYHRSNPRGVASLFRSYQKKFASVPPMFMGLNVSEFLAQMREALRPVVDTDPPPNRGEITLDPLKVPRIQLHYDPFANGEAEKYNRPATL